MNLQIFSQILDILRNEMRIQVNNELHIQEEVTLDTQLVEDLGFDILDKIEFLYDLEVEFEIYISERAGDAVITIRDAVAVVEERLDEVTR